MSCFEVLLLYCLFCSWCYLHLFSFILDHLSRSLSIILFSRNKLLAPLTFFNVCLYSLSPISAFYYLLSQTFCHLLCCSFSNFSGGTFSC